METTRVGGIKWKVIYRREQLKGFIWTDDWTGLVKVFSNVELSDRIEWRDGKRKVQMKNVSVDFMLVLQIKCGYT